MNSWSNKRDFGLLRRRMRVRVLPKIVLNEYFKQMENENRKVKEYETSVEGCLKLCCSVYCFFSMVLSQKVEKRNREENIYRRYIAGSFVRISIYGFRLLRRKIRVGVSLKINLRLCFLNTWKNIPLRAITKSNCYYALKLYGSVKYVLPQS